MDELGKRVTVAIRIRPKILTANNATQVAERYHPDACTKVGDSTIRLADSSSINGLGGNDSGKEGRMNSFTFDYVFDQDSSQLEVYEETTLDAVDAALSGGCNATIMTYGQTGSGKTYTVLGAVGNNPLSTDVVTPDTGLFLRVLKDVLAYAEARANQVHVVVGLTVTEVYLDTVRDLLAPLSGGEPPTLKVVVSDENTRMPDVCYRPVNEVRDAVQAYRTATNRRVSRATEANDQSSRSHAVFTIDIYQQRRIADLNPDPLSLEELIQLRDVAPVSKLKPLGGTSSTAAKKPPTPAAKTPVTATPPATPSSAEPPVKNAPPFDVSLASNPIIKVPGGFPPVVLSKIVLTDLAGSEKLKHSKAKGEALEEMKKINGSLTALGNVVHSLFTGSKHVPYRDSKLTIMLRTTFATPNNRIVLIANCAPTALTFDETLSTMFFADKVKAMKVDDASGASAAKAQLAMQLEADVLRLSKEQEELCGDMRILAQAYYQHAPVVRIGLLKVVQKDVGAFDAVGGFRPAFGCRQPIANKQNKVALKAIEDQTANLMVGRRAAEADALARLLTEEHDSLLNNLVTTHKDSMARAREFIRTNEAETKAMVSELDATAASLKKEVDEIEASSVKAAQAHTQLATRVNSLRPLKATLESEDAVLSSKVEVLEKMYIDKYSSQQKEWDEQCNVFAACEEEHSRQSRFFNEYITYLNARADYFASAAEVEDSRVEVVNAERDLQIFDVSQWIRRALLVMANNAVIRSNNALRAPKVPKTRPVAAGAANSTLPKAPPKARPNYADPNRRVQRANTPFDQPSLIGQIRTYMETGCTLLMYGKRGSPHFRFFYLSNQQNSPGGTSTEPRLYWCKDETERDNPEAVENYIDMGTVFRVTMGKTSNMFPSVGKETSGANDELPMSADDYYTSFAIHYLRDGHEPRIVCITAESKAEMEAWVIGVCDVCHVNPEFGEQLPIQDTLSSSLEKRPPAPSKVPAVAPSPSARAAEPVVPPARPTWMKDVVGEDGTVLSKEMLSKPAYAHLAVYCSTDLEIKLCSAWHVPPKVWLGCKVRIQTMSPKGLPPIPLTPGEVRQLFGQLDIFRANAVWELLAQLGMIERSSDSISYLTYTAD